MKVIQEGVVKKIYKQLRNDITFGKFKPGEHLSEKTLTQKYEASRATMREVIGQLASQGYLTVEPNRGAIVTKLSLEDVKIIYNILIRCESYAAKLFAEHPDEVNLKKLYLLHKKMQGENVKLNYKVWLQMNDEFHELIYTNCGSGILKELIYHTRLRIYRFRIVETDLKIIDLYNEQHSKILEAIHNGHGKLTEKLMIIHLKTAEKHRSKIFRDIGELL